MLNVLLTIIIIQVLHGVIAQIIAEKSADASSFMVGTDEFAVPLGDLIDVAAEIDITPYLKKGKNLIAFQTFRWCDGSWDEDQDFWRLSGAHPASANL